MHILILTHYYVPEVNAPASRLSELARAWVKEGHQVTVVTAVPSHPRGIIYPGYRNRFYQREDRGGVEVIRLWTLIAANEGFGRRTLNFLSYPLSLMMNLWRIPKSDVVISTSPQFFCGMAGWLLKRRRRIWVLEIRDLWPKSIAVLGAMKENLAFRALEWLERFAYRHADGIVSVTDSFVQHIEERLPAPKPIAVIKNGVDLDFYSEDGVAEAAQALRRELGIEGKFVAAYVGTHGLAHRLETILDAAERTRDDGIVYLMVGDGSERERLERARDERGLRNVLILGQRPKSDMPAIWYLTDASLVLLRKLDIYTEVLPSKMFEAMAMRRPIVLGVQGEARALLDDAGSGIGIVPEDAGQLAAAVQRLAANREEAIGYGESGRRFVERHFDRSRLADQYLDFLRQLVARQERP